MTRTRRLFIAAYAALVAACAAPELADAGDQTTPGMVTYVAYCQGCHGIAGDGNSDIAPYLDTPPADLTRLSERYGMPLDRKRLATAIDGREALRVHGPRSMPVWGEQFFSSAQPGTANLEEVRAEIIDALVDYLQSIQQAPQPAQKPPQP